jgi:AraC-like DNA-binding protein
MRRRSNLALTPTLQTSAVESNLGLFRREPLTTGPAGTLNNIFSDLRRMRRGEIIGENPARHSQVTRLHIDRAEGHAAWEFYRLEDDLYVVTADGVYDEARIETVPGEGLVEFHVRLAGALTIYSAGWSEPITVTGPKLLMLYQPPGVDISERIPDNLRDSCVYLYCKPTYLAELARRNGIEHLPMLEEIDLHPPTAPWHRELGLSTTLNYICTSLLHSPYRGGLRLLHAEAKVLELLCEVLASAMAETTAASPLSSQNEVRQLEAARRLLVSNLSAPLRICDIARAVGMSESKLKRAFKARFGITVFDYGLDRRMSHALELLRCKRMSVGQVAFAVGYRHQTSFASAFHEFFGFLPSKARTELH